MGPINQYSLLVNICLALVYSFNGWEGERNWVGTHRLVSRCAGDVVKSPFFSGAVGSVQLCWISVKGCHVWGLPVGNVRVSYMDWHEKRVCYVYQVSPIGCASI
jgi:hypothetical protein